MASLTERASKKRSNKPGQTAFLTAESGAIALSYPLRVRVLLYAASYVQCTVFQQLVISYHNFFYQRLYNTGASGVSPGFAFATTLKGWMQNWFKDFFIQYSPHSQMKTPSFRFYMMTTNTT